MNSPVAAVDFSSSTRVSSRSVWTDTVWHLDGVPPGTPHSEFSLNWTLELEGGSLTDSRWRPLCEAAKTFLWSLSVDPPEGRTAARASTLVATFKSLRLLMRWMATEGYRHFVDLDREASERFITTVAARRGRAGQALKSGTLHSYRNLLELLYLQGVNYPHVAIAEPFPGLGRRAQRRTDRQKWPYTPDTLAVKLVASALRLIETPADEIIDLQAAAQRAYDAALARGLRQTKAGFAAVDAISTRRFSTLRGEKAPWYPSPVSSTKEVRQLVDRICEACFVVVAYLVGARVSEILGLTIGCIEHHPSADGTSVAYLRGHIYKTAAAPGGNPHRWVAPPAVERAVAVMERLTESLRQRTGRPELWLSMTSLGMIGPSARIGLPTASTIANRLNSGFAPFIGLPLHEGKRWRLNTHQGRKTFARFVGKRDRTGLHALQAHLGHVSRAMTDHGYVGTDFVHDDLIDRQAQEETRAALEELLTATALGGKGGRIVAGRSRFRGRTRDGNLQEYVDFLMKETDLRLGVCDWGYCVYRTETSACHGNEKGPNPVLRTESVCAKCVNFAVTSKHRPVWEGRRERNAALLEQPALDPQSRALAQARIGECERILAQLDQDERAA